MTYPRHLRLEKWVNNGIEGTNDVLIGNAAYRLNPLPMHDTSLGIADAFLLAKMLAFNEGTLPSRAKDPVSYAVLEIPLGTLLANYESKRKPQIERYQKMASKAEVDALRTSKIIAALKGALTTVENAVLSTWKAKRVANELRDELK